MYIYIYKKHVCICFYIKFDNQYILYSGGDNIISKEGKERKKNEYMNSSATSSSESAGGIYSTF